MIEPFESHAHQWIQRHQKAAEDCCQKNLAATPAGQNNLDRFVKAAATAHPPLVLPSLGQDSYQQACSEHLLEDEYGAPSFDFEPRLGPAVAIPLGPTKVIPIPLPHIDSDSNFERQDPQVAHTKFENIMNTFLSIAGNLYQLREVLDYWLPKGTQAEFEAGRFQWLPSLIFEQARLRTIHEFNSVQLCFMENLQVVNNALSELTEGTFGGRLNMRSITTTKQLFDKLRILRKLILKLAKPASDRSRALNSAAKWFAEKGMPAFADIKEPYRPERFHSDAQSQSHLVQLFQQHTVAMNQTLRFIAQAFHHLSQVFGTVVCICKTMTEGLHKIMFDVHSGQTTGEFIASWASRWERVSFGLLIRILGLPAINSGLQRDFPGMEVEFVYHP